MTMNSSLSLFELTRRMVDIPSVTGQEGAAADFLHDFMRTQGWECLKQEVAPERYNVLAWRGRPSILLTTHMDTVPPFVPSAEDEEYLYGRGSCDAKGIAAAMIAAAQELSREGITDLALLFVVGEEVDSAGAVKARELPFRWSFVINGEPTDNDLAVGHKGIVYARLSCRGVAAHSAYPEKGESAVAKLLIALDALNSIEFPVHPEMGASLVNIGTLRAGRAPNVIPDEAEAEILIRTVEPSERYVRLLQEALGHFCQLQVVKTSEPQRMEKIPGFSTKVVGYGTDIPALRELGRPLLIGPGSILDAHTAHERISKKALVDAVQIYKSLVIKLKEQDLKSASG
jgi:acetylornithine deacetylase